MRNFLTYFLVLLVVVLECGLLGDVSFEYLTADFED